MVDLALVNRNHHLAGHDEPENDVVHSFAVAMLCWFIHDKYKLGLDLEKVLKYALTHDFAEVYAGDVNTYASKEARQQKIETEKIATGRLCEEFKEFKDLAATLRDYEAEADEEALFVWTVDKMQAYILGDLDDWRPYKKVGISYDRFAAKHSEQLSVCSPHCKEIFETVLEYCTTTYYDRPKAESAV